MKAASRVPVMALCMATILMAFQAQADDAAKQGYRLARDATCLVCHEVETPPSSAAVLPPAPSFEDIARRYRADPQAADKLAAIVRDGTGPLRRDRHWDRKAAFERMYPNDLALTEEEARAIVEWILTLAPGQSAERGRHARHERVEATATRP